jgi:hypothetical protein
MDEKLQRLTKEAERVGFLVHFQKKADVEAAIEAWKLVEWRMHLVRDAARACDKYAESPRYDRFLDLYLRRVDRVFKAFSEATTIAKAAGFTGKGICSLDIFDFDGDGPVPELIDCFHFGWFMGGDLVGCTRNSCQRRLRGTKLECLSGDRWLLE